MVYKFIKQQICHLIDRVTYLLVACLWHVYYYFTTDEPNTSTEKFESF